MEVIEGEEMDVKTLYFDKIIHDKNNLRSKIILEGYVEQRDFSAWVFGPEELFRLAIRFHVERIGDQRYMDLTYNILKYFNETGESSLINFWNSSKDREELMKLIEKNY